ncbi:DUF1127 domain-containing protein [Zavarzinia sp. CC-PAN008]|uniref:DUF1127 domain-containing protein n=1 Tax=Zavarzinia sp. CC-PAN008 TaxID=3243332 RepID=UPI003F742B93
MATGFKQRTPITGTAYTVRRARFDWARLLQTWIIVARQRRHLAGLNDHLLKDLGLSRADVEAEVRRPFWDVGSGLLNRGERA